MANSADPDQLASSEANWSGATLFAKAGYILAQHDKGSACQGLTSDKALFSTEKYLFFSYFCMKTYIMVLIRSVSLRRFQWLLTTYVFMER